MKYMEPGDVKEKRKSINNIKPEWKNPPSFDDLYSDYKTAQDDHSQIINRLDKWRMYMNGGPEIKLPKGRSTVRPKLIRKQAEWKYPALEEPFLNTENMFRIKPRTWEDQKAAEQNELVINYQWATKVNKVQLVGDIVRTIVDEGTVIVKTGWEVEEDTKEIEETRPIYADGDRAIQLLAAMVAKGDITEAEMQQRIASGSRIQVGEQKVKVKKTVLTKNQPTYEVCNNRDVIIDPTAKGDLSSARFIIHEYDTDLATLKENEYKKIEHEDENRNIIVEEHGIYHNLNKIVIEESNSKEYDYDYDNTGESIEPTFTFKDKPRKKIRAYEYWGYWDINGNGKLTPIIATWVGKVLIRLEENPFPFDGLPFSIAQYMPQKEEIYGEPDAELLAENQDSIGKMMRAAHDITATMAVGQEFIDEQFFASPSQRDNYRSGRTVYFRHGMDPRTAIFKQSVDPVPPAVFQMIEYHQNDAESMTGTKAFFNGIGSQALGSVATGIRSAMDATAKRELSILRRLSENLFKDMARKTIIMNQAFLDESEVIRITNDEFVAVRREDLAGEFDLIVDVSTPEKDNEKAEKLNMLMQTNAASMDPELAKIIYARIAKLWKEPDLAHEVLSYQPKPDPATEELKKIQIENAMLENQKLKMQIAEMAKKIESEDSKIEERKSRVAQNLTSETQENMATARLKNAQAAKLEEEVDNLQYNFLKKYTGEERKEKIEDKEAEWLAKADIEALRLQHKQELEKLKAEAKIKEAALNKLLEQRNNNGIL